MFSKFFPRKECLEGQVSTYARPWRSASSSRSTSLTVQSSGNCPCSPVCPLRTECFSHESPEWLTHGRGCMEVTQSSPSSLHLVLAASYESGSQWPVGGAQRTVHSVPPRNGCHPAPGLCEARFNL